MKIKYIFFLIILFLQNISFSEIIKPSPNLKPQEVIEIQLNALKNNNLPYLNAGIEQTWEFAHPSNKIYTGPINNFKKLMYTKSYSMMLNHIEHTIIPIEYNEDSSFFFIELIDIEGHIYGFQWIVSKVLTDGEFQNCWMTISVSQPIEISKSS